MLTRTLLGENYNRFEEFVINHLKIKRIKTPKVML